MVKPHGLNICQDCRRIFLLIVNQKTMDIRFNALLRLCRTVIDPKYSAPRLQRHLEGLEGKRIERTEKKPHDVHYSPILPKNLDPETLVFEPEMEKLTKLSLNKLVKMKMHLYSLMSLEKNISDIESLLNRQTPQENYSRFLFLETVAQQSLDIIDKALINRTEDEYIEVLKRLKNEKDQLLKIKYIFD